MLQHCNRIHTENYNESCCLQHLIEMNEYAELKTLHDRYARLLMKTLNHSYKLNEISFRQLNLTYVRSFLDIMTKYIAHFYFLNKFDYSKLLVKIALKATDDTPYKDHPEIIMRTSAVFNNIACIYESIKSYEKALRYLNYNKKISMPTHDKLIFLNNLIRINLKLNRKNEAEEILKNFAFIFKDVIKTMKKEMHTNDKNTIHSSQVNLQKLQLLAYLYYNWGMCLEILQKKKEAKEVFNKGYQFCLCWLGEFNLLTRKFIKKIKYNCEKLSTIHTPIQIKNKRNCFDSDGDQKKNNTDAMRKKSSHSILPLRSTTDFSSPIRLRHNLSLNKDKRKGKDSKNEFNLKLDMIINRLDHLDTKIVNETLPNIKTVKPTEMDQTQDEKDKLTHDQNDQMTNKRENFKMISSQFSNPLKVSKERASVLSVDRLKMMMKPKLRILIETTGNNKSSNNNVIDDIMKEVQDEAVRKSRGSIGSLDIGRKSSLTIKDDFPRSSSIKSMNNDSFIGRDISIIQSDPHLKHMSTMSLQSKDNGKINEVQGDINKKDLKIKKLFNKVLDIKQPTKSSLQTQGKLAGILSQLVDSKDNETNKMPDRKSEQFMYHNLMDKLDKEENYVEVNRSLTKEENLIDEMTKDNNCLDNDLKENLKSEMKQMTISLNLEDEDTKYEFVPYFQTKPNDNKEENQEPISMATIQDSNPKEKLIKEMNNFSFNVIAHEDEDTYECKTLYFGNDSLKEKPKSNGDSMLKSIVSGVKIELNDYACDPKEVIEADIKFETYQRQLEGMKLIYLI